MIQVHTVSTLGVSHTRPAAGVPTAPGHRVRLSRRTQPIHEEEGDGEESEAENDARHAADEELPPSHSVHQCQTYDGEEEIGSSRDGRQPDGALVREASHLNDGGTVVPAHTKKAYRKTSQDTREKKLYQI